MLAQIRLIYKSELCGEKWSKQRGNKGTTLSNPQAALHTFMIKMSLGDFLIMKVY
jgi:hypothetical protein